MDVFSDFSDFTLILKRGVLNFQWSKFSVREVCLKMKQPSFQLERNDQTIFSPLSSSQNWCQFSGKMSKHVKNWPFLSWKWGLFDTFIKTQVSLWCFCISLSNSLFLCRPILRASSQRKLFNAKGLWFLIFPCWFSLNAFGKRSTIFIGYRCRSLSLSWVYRRIGTFFAK